MREWGEDDSSSCLTKIPVKQQQTMAPQQHNELGDFELYPGSVSSKSTVQKQLRFSLSSNETFFIPHINNLSDEEVNATWYECGDYGKIKTAMIPLIRKMMKGATIEETDQETIRGLEYRTRKGAIRRQHNKAEAISAVLEEQDRQIEADGEVDDEMLSAVYRQISAHCQEEAHQLALGDVEPAREHAAFATEMLMQSQKTKVKKYLTIKLI